MLVLYTQTLYGINNKLIKKQSIITFTIQFNTNCTFLYMYILVSYITSKHDFTHIIICNLFIVN